MTCSKSCRQARNRFALAVGRAKPASPVEPMRFAYADPPYPGKSKRYYGDHRDYAGEVDHVALLERLSHYDGWALSTSASALQCVLALCPPGSRVAAWVRGPRTNKAAIVLNAWEPVIYFGARPVVPDVEDASRRAAAGHDTSSDTTATEDVAAIAYDVSRRAGTTRRHDTLILGVTARTTDPHRVVGAKPATFARWMFDLLGAMPGDQLDDLFPGSGAIARAWGVYTGSEVVA